MNKVLNNLKIDLEKTFKDKLASIILYGSAAGNEFNPKASDINLIVIIEDLSAKDLKDAHKTVKKWLRSKNPAPLFIDKQEWINSSDVYAIEYSDIKERYKILFGENLIVPLAINKQDIRLQCESEIKHTLIKLRQTYMLNCKDKNTIKEMLKSSSRATIAIFRAILRLYGEIVPENNKDVVNKLSEKFDFNHNVFIDILLFKENKKKFNGKELENTVQDLINSLNEILNHIDKFKVQAEV